MKDAGDRASIALVIGGNVRAARERIGLTQEHVAELSGLHRTEVGKLERGGGIPRADTLFKIAVALRLDDPGPLFAGLSYTPPPSRLIRGTWETRDSVEADRRPVTEGRQ